jgi:hypothetical protein
MDIKYWRANLSRAILAACVIGGFLVLYGGGIVAYKWINWHYNGQFVLTNRGSWAFYGNTARNLAPLTPRQWAAKALFIPTNGAECWQILKPADECRYWTFAVSDELGQRAFEALHRQNLKPEHINKTLIHMSFNQMAEHPIQTVISMIMESMKFMFWEFNVRFQDEYATFPLWLQHMYGHQWLYIALHYGVALLTFIALLGTIIFLGLQREVIFSPKAANFEACAGLFFTLIFVVAFIFSYSFFYCSGRYAMPLAPLFLVQIAYVAQILSPLCITSCKKKKQRLE